MSIETENTKESILDAAVAAAAEGLGSAFATEDLMAEIRQYWSGRFEDNRSAILTLWSQLGEKALSKAKKIGAQAATMAGEQKSSAVTLSLFQSAITEINKTDESSNWC